MAKLISQTEKYELNLDINDAREREKAAIETIYETAKLAAEQVAATKTEFNTQAKIPQPKKPPTIGFLTSIVEFVIDAAFTGIAGKIIELGIKDLIKPVFLSRFAYFDLAKISHQQKLKEKYDIQPFINARRIDIAVHRISKQLQADQIKKPGTDHFKALKELPKKIMTQRIEQKLSPIKGSISKLATPSSTNKAPSLPLKNQAALMVPYLTIAAHAFEQFKRQQVTLNLQYGVLVAQLTHLDIDEDTAKIWKEFVNKNISKYPMGGVGVIKTHLFLWYEFSMWAIQYKPIRPLWYHRDKQPGSALNSVNSGRVDRIKDIYGDVRNYKILKSDENKRVVYLAPRGAPVDSHMENIGFPSFKLTETTIEIPKFILNYLIGKFHARTNVPALDELTFLGTASKNYENHWDKRQIAKGDDLKKHREDQITIKAYQKLETEFMHWWADFDKSIKNP